MIKRALGLFDIEKEQDDDSDEEIEEDARRRLERRLIPGAIHSSTSMKRQQAKKRNKDEESSSETDQDASAIISVKDYQARKAQAKRELEEALETEEPKAEKKAKTTKKAGAKAKKASKAKQDEKNDQESEDEDPNIFRSIIAFEKDDDSEIKFAGGGSDSEDEDHDDLDEGAEGDSDDEEFPTQEVEPEEQVKRGKFMCQLCPDKVLVSQSDLDKHLESKAHLKNVQNYVKAQEMGVEAYIEECEKRREQRESVKAGLSKKQQRREAYFDKQKAKKKDPKCRAKRFEKMTDDQIEAKKAKFAAKKARRMARKAGTDAA
mmetsp:Transcript_67430/g.140896  ORF Transcript_67430/g.140896 Transcript_67430/m.140896 type:complete len:319 (-) Transcript_67430:52-1008(-)